MSVLRDHNRPPPGGEPPAGLQALPVPRGWNERQIRAFHARLALLRSLCRRRAPSVLDIDCCGGDELMALAPLMGIGVGLDVRAPEIQRARIAARDMHLDNLHFAVGDAVAFHLDDRRVPETFDLVLVRGRLKGDRAAVRVLRAARRRLTPGGRVLVIQPHAHHPAILWLRLWSEGRAVLPDPDGLTPGLVRRLAVAAGLESIAYQPLPWAPAAEQEGALEARGPWARRLGRLPLERLPHLADRASFALLLRAAG